MLVCSRRVLVCSRRAHRSWAMGSDAGVRAAAGRVATNAACSAGRSTLRVVASSHRRREVRAKVVRAGAGRAKRSCSRVRGPHLSSRCPDTKGRKWLRRRRAGRPACSVLVASPKSFLEAALLFDEVTLRETGAQRPCRTRRRLKSGAPRVIVGDAARHFRLRNRAAVSAPGHSRRSSSQPVRAARRSGWIGISRTFSPLPRIRRILLRADSRTSWTTRPMISAILVPA